MDNNEIAKMQEEEIASKFNSRIWDSFEYEQRREVMQVFKRLMPRVLNHHLIDFRITFWLFVKFYLVVFIGRDNRTGGRQTHHSNQARFLYILSRLFVGSFLVIGIIFSILILLYLIKSMAGIDIFPDSHLIDLLSF